MEKVAFVQTPKGANVLMLRVSSPKEKERVLGRENSQSG